MDLRREKSELSRLQREVSAIVAASSPGAVESCPVDDAYTLAKASMILEALGRAKATGLAPSHPDYPSLEVGEPSPKLLAEAQRASTARWPGGS